MATSQQDLSQSFDWHHTQLDDRNFQIHGHTLFYVITLFLVIIILILIFLYARWICAFNRVSNPASLPHPLRSRPQGLDPSIINALPITLHGEVSLELKEKECCICLGEFEDGDKVKSLPHCGHFFHSDCVDMWLSSHSSCPLCRVAVALQIVIQ